jgi:hypothetical protein
MSHVGRAYGSVRLVGITHAVLCYGAADSLCMLIDRLLVTTYWQACDSEREGCVGYQEGPTVHLKYNVKTE